MVSQYRLTVKQQFVYEFLQRFFAEHHHSPLIREVQEGCQITSYKSALDRLGALERKGFIRRIPNKHRGIKLVRRAAEVTADVTISTSQPLKAEGAEEQVGV